MFVHFPVKALIFASSDAACAVWASLAVVVVVEYNYILYIYYCWTSLWRAPLLLAVGMLCLSFSMSGGRKNMARQPVFCVVGGLRPRKSCSHQWFFTTFCNLWFYYNLYYFMHSFIFSTPLMKYCHFLHLNISICASMLARCMCPNWRSHARGVRKMENVIPMLGGKHIFLWSPCSVGVPLLLFSTPLRR